MPQKLPITREQAIELLKSMPQQQSDWNHYLESEAIMKALAEKLGEDVEYWAMLGLFHDIDWALTKENLKEHCIKAVEILKEKGFGSEFIQIIQSHGYGYVRNAMKVCISEHPKIPKKAEEFFDKEIPALADKKRENRIEHALAASETATGLIYAYALMRGKKISDMEVSGLKKKFKDKRFDENCNREIIKEIEQTGISLDEFFGIAIKAMQEIKGGLGLYRKAFIVQIA